MRTLLVVCTLYFTTAFGQSPEAVVIGGACLTESGFPSALVKRYFAENRKGNKPAVLELTKQIVRNACSNEHWWLKLAQTYMESDRVDDAVRTLDIYHARGGANGVDARLRDPQSPLSKLTASPIFRNSHLAKRIMQDRASLDKRRAQAKARLANESRPSEEYVAKKSCPFECCVFRRWSVKADTLLYDAPKGTKVIATAKKGTNVTGLTGEVHLRPAPVLVRFPSPEGFTAKKDDIVYLLNYTGEGHGYVWVKGKIVDAEVMSVAEHCPNPSADCWGEFVNPEDAGSQRKHEWWVRVKTSNGLIGWTKQAENFGDMDACG